MQLEAVSALGAEDGVRLVGGMAAAGAGADRASELPQEAQNFPPSALTPQLGQLSLARVSRSRFWGQSFCYALSFAAELVAWL